MDKIKLLFGVFLFLSLSCSHDVNSVRNNRGDTLGFYLLADLSISAVEASQQKLGSLQLAAQPLIDLTDIDYYDWNEQRFSVSGQVLAELWEVIQTHRSVRGIPFVVVANKQPISLGAFWFGHSSIAPLFPFIEVTPLVVGDSSHVLVINRSWNHEISNARMDPEIYRILRQTNKLLE